MGDSFVGIQARLMSQALRKLTGAVSRSNTSLVFTNQLREKIGVMFGNPETTPGGRALKFYASRPPRHPARRDDQDRHRVGRQPGPRQGREEQGRAAVPRRRVRRHVRRGHLQGGRPARRRRRDGRRHQDRRLVHLRRDAARPGSRGVQGVPQGQPGRRRRRSSGASAARIADEAAVSRSRASKRPSRRADAWPGRSSRTLRRTPRASAPRVDDPQVVLEAAGAVPRGAVALGRRGPPPADVGGLPARARRRRHRPAARARHARRRGVRARLGRVARPGPAARRAGDPPGARAQGHRPGDRRRGPRRSTRRRGDRSTRTRWPSRSTGPRRAPDRQARTGARARRRPAAARQRAYALLARNGFDPETCREVAARAAAEPSDLDDRRSPSAPRGTPRRSRRPPGSPTPGSPARADRGTRGRARPPRRGHAPGVPEHRAWPARATRSRERSRRSTARSRSRGGQIQSGQLRGLVVTATRSSGGASIPARSIYRSKRSRKRSSNTASA